MHFHRLGSFFSFKASILLLLVVQVVVQAMVSEYKYTNRYGKAGENDGKHD